MNRRIYDRVVSILVHELRINERQIGPESLIVADLGAKSIDIIEVIMRIEEEFQEEIPDFDLTPPPFDLSPDMTVRDLAELLSYA